MLLLYFAGCVQTVAIIGPIFGFLLGSLCAKLYVDIGFVNLGKDVYFYLFILVTVIFNGNSVQISNFFLQNDRW